MEEISLEAEIERQVAYAIKRRCVMEHVSAPRFISWINDPKRKTANTAFTEGPERQVAYAIEALILEERSHYKKICL